MNAEQKRLEARRAGREDWRLWGPYLAERAWGTVREDYSADGTAWEHFSHDQARSRAYRWSEDGLAGLCDRGQRLCLALALWNGRDPILKERAFGLTGNEGNHGEDVKELYFYLDATPTASYLRYLYKYPQEEYPYALLAAEARRRSRRDPAFQLLDTGVFEDNRYWDVEVVYAKLDPGAVLARITAHNRGPDAATLHLLPTLWFRNTWSWANLEEKAARPRLYAVDSPAGAAWAVHGEHPELGAYHFFGAQEAELLFTENETNFERLWNVANPGPYVKDAFHRRVIGKEETSVNPARTGTKCAAWTVLTMGAGESASVELVLASQPGEVCGTDTHGAARAEVLERLGRKGRSKGGRGKAPAAAPGFLGAAAGLTGLLFGAPARKGSFRGFDRTLDARRAEADAFYDALLPSATPEDAAIHRQALAGLLWSQQFYHYDVARWLDGDALPPPESRKHGRNRAWRHFKAADVIAMPDTWEYPWFAAWDLAFHCVALTLVDLDLAKEQAEVLLGHRYQHPNGQVPAYEWAFGDVNPPLQAWAALECFEAERACRGAGDRDFLHRVFHKLLLNYPWWLNRKDPDGRAVFEGGFMGLDNISVYDRSRPLPPGYRLKQADASGWMALYALNLTAMAIELAQDEPAYQDLAIQLHGQFFAIAEAMHGWSETGVALWDERDRFFKDAVATPGGSYPLSVFSWVGMIPLFGAEVVGPGPLAKLPRYREFLQGHAGGVYNGHIVCACPHTENPEGSHLFSLALPAHLPDILARVLSADEFLSPHGARALSRAHGDGRSLGDVPGLGEVTIPYEPGESESGLFGGNSNWRGPVWMPLNFLLVRALEKLHRYLGDSFTVTAPGHQPVTLGEAADLVSERLLGLFRRNDRGLRPIFPPDSPFQGDPHWEDLLLFHEYFHGETGQGLGASHQTGWTALVANLLVREYALRGRKEKP
ncbi:MAG: hypothetical protein SCH98_02155 [Deferrisomatales bacterium]|nr:hypothetical protein [Deferrisomatales bacterium]